MVVDLIVTTGGDTAANAAQMAATRIPISSWRKRPGRNGTGKELRATGGNITGSRISSSSWYRSEWRSFTSSSQLKRVLLVYDATNAVAVSRLKVHREAAHASA